MTQAAADTLSGAAATAGLPFWVQIVAAFGPIVLSLALAVITWRYTVYTKRMVDEMRAARSTQIMPKLVPTLQITDLDEPGSGHLRVFNAGMGPAFRVNVEVALEPNGKRWRW